MWIEYNLPLVVGIDFNALANLAFDLAIVVDGVTPVVRRFMDLLLEDS